MSTSSLSQKKTRPLIRTPLFTDKDLCGIVNKPNVHIQGSENPHASVEFVLDSPKVNEFCALSEDKVYGMSIFIHRRTVLGMTYKYLDMLDVW